MKTMPKVAWRIFLPVMLVLLTGVAISIAACHFVDRNPAFNTSATFENWPWFADSYFNIKFQYPPGWKVEKLDVTNYYDDSQLDLAGEDAALAGPDSYKTWVLEIIPPYQDIQSINRGELGEVRARIVVEQPNPLCENTLENRRYESVLKPYGENFRFSFTDHFTMGNGMATTSLSFGRSPDGAIAGIAAIRLLQSRYCYRMHMTMTESLGHTESNLIAFMSVINSVSLLATDRNYTTNYYRVPVQPEEYRAPVLR